MIDIHLYGKLRRFAEDPRADRDSIVTIEPHPNDTIGSLLSRAGIPLDEVHHIFFNSRLLATRTAMASVADFPQYRTSPFDWSLDVPVNDGDRIGLFARDIALLGQ